MKLTPFFHPTPRVDTSTCFFQKGPLFVLHKSSFKKKILRLMKQLLHPRRSTYIEPENDALGSDVFPFPAVYSQVPC